MTRHPFDQLAKQLLEQPNEEELAMPLPQAFLEWEKQVEERGKQEGLEQGIKTVAMNLIRTGMSLSQVSEVTGLSLEDLRKLQNLNDSN